MVPNLLHQQTLSLTLSQRIKGYFEHYTILLGKKFAQLGKEIHYEL